LAGLSETPHDDGALSAPNDRLAGAPSTQDFVHKVAISDMFEIQSSQLAVAKQADADTNAGRVEGHTLGRRAFGTTAAPPVDTAGSKHGAA
jgi:hypothetical protein